jgi:hypothetical protein
MMISPVITPMRSILSKLAVKVNKQHSDEFQSWNNWTPNSELDYKCRIIKAEAGIIANNQVYS